MFILKIEFDITGIQNNFDNFSDLTMLILLTADEINEIEIHWWKTFSELDWSNKKIESMNFELYENFQINFSKFHLFLSEWPNLDNCLSNIFFGIWILHRQQKLFSILLFLKFYFIIKVPFNLVTCFVIFYCIKKIEEKEVFAEIFIKFYKMIFF